MDFRRPPLDWKVADHDFVVVGTKRPGLVDKEGLEGVDGDSIDHFMAQ